jgi:hypothetical protein
VRIFWATTSLMLSQGWSTTLIISRSFISRLSIGNRRTRANRLSTTPLISTSRSGPIPSKLPAHQSLINRRLGASASCYAQPILLNRIHAAAERTGTAIVLDHGHENHGEEVFGRALREVPFQQAAGEGLYFLPQQRLRRQ